MTWIIHDTRERVALCPAQNIIHMRLDSFESLISPKLNAQLASVFVSLSDQKPRTLLHIFETSSPITRLWLEIFLHRCDAVAVFFALVSAETTRLRRLILAKFRSCLSEDNTSRERLANFLRTSCPCTCADFCFSPCGNKMNRSKASGYTPEHEKEEEITTHASTGLSRAFGVDRWSLFKAAMAYTLSFLQCGSHVCGNQIFIKHTMCTKDLFLTNLTSPPLSLLLEPHAFCGCLGPSATFYEILTFDYRSWCERKR